MTGGSKLHTLGPINHQQHIYMEFSLSKDHQVTMGLFSGGLPQDVTHEEAPLTHPV